jgi:hypothetical protein
MILINKTYIYKYITTISTILEQKFDDHIGVMVSNRDYSYNAREEGNNLKIMMCRTENLVKKLMDHINYLKKNNDKIDN